MFLCSSVSHPLLDQSSSESATLSDQSSSGSATSRQTATVLRSQLEQDLDFVLSLVTFWAKKVPNGRTTFQKQQQKKNRESKDESNSVSLCGHQTFQFYVAATNRGRVTSVNLDTDKRKEHSKVHVYDGNTESTYSTQTKLCTCFATYYLHIPPGASK